MTVKVVLYLPPTPAHHLPLPVNWKKEPGEPPLGSVDALQRNIPELPDIICKMLCIWKF